MWWPQMTIRPENPNLSLEDLTSALEQKFPNYQVRAEKQGLCVKKSFFTGVLVTLSTEGVIKAEPFYPSRILRGLDKFSESMLSCRFCYSRHIREIGSFLQETFGVKGLEAQPVPHRLAWTWGKALLFLVLPTLAVYYIMGMGWQFPPSREMLQGRTWWYVLFGIFGCASVPLLYLSYAMDELPDNWQLPYLSSLAAYLLFVIGVVALSISLGVLVLIAWENISPPAQKTAKPSTAALPSSGAETARDYFKRAYRAKDPDEKIRLYSRAIELNPKYTMAFNNRGAAYAKKKAYDQALADYNQAIALDPKSAYTYSNRATTYMQQKKLDLALQDVDKAIALKPDYYQAYFQRGLLHKRGGEMDKALSDFTQAINIKSDYTPAYYQRAVVRRDLGNLEQARQDYEKAKSLNPKLPNPLGN